MVEFDSFFEKLYLTFEQSCADGQVRDYLIF